MARAALAVIGIFQEFELLPDSRLVTMQEQLERIIRAAVRPLKAHDGITSDL